MRAVAAVAATAAAAAVLLYTQLHQSAVLEHGLQTVLQVQSVFRGPVSHAMILVASLLGGGELTAGVVLGAMFLYDQRLGKRLLTLTLLNMFVVALLKALLHEPRPIWLSADVTPLVSGELIPDSPTHGISTQGSVPAFSRAR